MQLIQTIASIAVLLNGASAVSSSSNGVTYNGIVDPVTGHSRYLGVSSSVNIYNQSPSITMLLKSNYNTRKYFLEYTSSLISEMP